MTSPAVLQLQEYATDEQHGVSELLRKALLVATKLKLPDFKNWISSELNGYNDGESLPAYRIIQGELRGLHPHLDPIPLIIKNNEALEKATRVIQILDSVSSLTNLAESKNSLHSARLPHEMETILMSIQNSSVQYPPVRVFTT